MIGFSVEDRTQFTAYFYRMMKFQMNGWVAVVFMLFVGGLLMGSEGQAQMPDLMFAIEGTYIGRLETQLLSDGSGDTASVDVRLDGRRNAAEDGFVLQWAFSEGETVRKKVAMWRWDSEMEMLEVTYVNNRSTIVERWHVKSVTKSRVVLVRGGSHDGEAVLIRLAIERFPGQLKFDQYTNDGSGSWTFLHRYVLADAAL
jgi:hypothetical protein